jgi:hypothetical protein
VQREVESELAMKNMDVASRMTAEVPAKTLSADELRKMERFVLTREGVEDQERKLVSPNV